MILLLIWVVFVFSLSLAKELDQLHYFLFSSLMFYLSYLYHQTHPAKVPLLMNVCLLVIPSIIFWYIAFVYNNFLCLTPLSQEVLVSMVFFHIYVMVYVFWECSQ